MRLIDADALIEAMKKAESEYESAMACPSWWSAFNVISEQPTAYDIDKVVEEFEKIRAKETCNKEKCDTKEICRICVVDDAIEIVKQGGVSDVYGGMSVIKSCEYEDINKADCINCFNGLPANECKYYEEIEGKKLRQMVHERAQRDRKKEYNKAIDDFVTNVKDALITDYSVFNTDDIRIFIDMIEELAEQLKVCVENE